MQTPMREPVSLQYVRRYPTIYPALAQSVLKEFHGPDVGQRAKRLGKAQSNVSRALQRLAKHGFANMVRDGREVRPVLVAQFLKVDLLEGTVQPDSDSAAAA